MGNNQSAKLQEKLEHLTTKQEELEYYLNQANEKIEVLNKEAASKAEVEPKLDLLDKTNSRLNQKLFYLLEITKSQQQIIVDLSSKYSNLCDEYDKQQLNFYEFQNKYNDASKINEDSLKSIDTRLNVLEKRSLESTDFSDLFKVKRTDNMIKKEKKLSQIKSKEKATPTHKEKASPQKLEQTPPQQTIDKPMQVETVTPPSQVASKVSPQPGFVVIPGQSLPLADFYNRRDRLQKVRSQRKQEKLSICENVSKFVNPLEEVENNRTSESEKKPKKPANFFVDKRLSAIDLNTFKF